MPDNVAFGTDYFVHANSKVFISYAMPGAKKMTRVQATYLGNEVIGSAVFMFFEQVDIKGRATRVTRYGLNADTIKRIDPVEDEVRTPRKRKTKLANSATPAEHETSRKVRKKKTPTNGRRKKKTRKKKRVAKKKTQKKTRRKKTRRKQRPLRRRGIARKKTPTNGRRKKKTTKKKP